MFKVQEEPIRVGDLYDTVLRDYNGAVITFSGVVRDHTGDKRTDHLVYEAYGPMAEKKMAEIAAEAKEKWAVEEIAILHRVGRLEIGETSVLIAVGSRHRKEAFSACQYTIDRLKEVVPIWKKEVGDDGSFWVEGPKVAAEA